MFGQIIFDSQNMPIHNGSTRQILRSWKVQVSEISGKCQSLKESKNQENPESFKKCNEIAHAS
jgi:hypothetical protein